MARLPLQLTVQLSATIINTDVEATAFSCHAALSGTQGLRSFIRARYDSVRQQLAGERPGSYGVGSSNGGSLWIADLVEMMAGQ